MFQEILSAYILVVLFCSSILLHPLAVFAAGSFIGPKGQGEEEPWMVDRSALVGNLPLDFLMKGGEPGEDPLRVDIKS